MFHSTGCLKISLSEFVKVFGCFIEMMGTFSRVKKVNKERPIEGDFGLKRWKLKVKEKLFKKFKILALQAPRCVRMTVIIMILIHSYVILLAAIFVIIEPSASILYMAWTVNVYDECYPGTI